MRKFIVAAVPLVSASCFAAQSDTGATNVIAPWLEISSSVRSAGMGDAYTAVSSDLDGLQTNPAGIAGLTSQQLELSHNAWIQSTSIEHVAYGLPIGGGAGVAASLDYLNLGTLDKTVLDPATGLPAAEGTYSPNALHFDLAYGQTVGELGVGAAVKLISQNINGSGSSGSAFDIGAIERFKGTGVALGAAIQNFGGMVNGYKLPFYARVGGAYTQPFLNQYSGTLAADADLNVTENSLSTYNVGAEAWYQHDFVVRVGYKSSNQDNLTNNLSGLNFGLGLRYSAIELDLAMEEKGDLGSANQVSLLANF